MNQANAIIHLDALHLGRHPTRMDARAGAEFVALLSGVPDDVEDVVVRVCGSAANGGFHDFPAMAAASGEWVCRILGPAFPEAGAGWYEVRAVSASGNMTALGRGPVRVHPWSAESAVPLDARRRSVMVIPDENGGMHAIYAVRDDAGAWAFVVGDIDDPATVGAQTVTVGAVGAGAQGVLVRPHGDGNGNIDALEVGTDD